MADLDALSAERACWNSAWSKVQVYIWRHATKAAPKLFKAILLSYNYPKALFNPSERLCGAFRCWMQIMGMRMQGLFCPLEHSVLYAIDQVY